LIQPFSDAARESAGLRLFAWQPAVEFGNARPFVEENPTVFARPAVALRVKRRDPSDRKRGLGRDTIDGWRWPLRDGLDIDQVIV
jgi:hypothetical protein